MLDELIRDDLREFASYQSARTSGLSAKIMLNANELPWLSYNRYPNKQPSELINLFATFYEVSDNKILITRGIDEGVDLLIRLFCAARKDKIIICPPTFGMYEVSAKLQGAEVIEIPLVAENNFSIDVDKIIQSWKPELKIIFICSPNNPTGNEISKTKIIQLCEAMQNKAIVVVDEAYIEFSDSPSVLSMLDSFDNLVVLRTLSKAFGLAAVRCGVLFANPALVSWLGKIIAPYPIPEPSVKAVINRFNDIEQIKSFINVVKKERGKIFSALSNCEMVRCVLASEANFISFTTNDNDFFMSECLKNNILIRQLKNLLRVSVGSPEQNQFFIETIGGLNVQPT